MKIVTILCEKGIKRCTRSNCNRTMKVWRVGMVGVGGKSGRWMKLSKSKEDYIDSLPTM